MARLARIVIPGIAHHVTQRGNRRAQIFFSDDDRRRYLSLFALHKRRYGLRVWAYCLMDNHVHWVVVPEREEALAETFRETHAQYADKLNRASSQSGHLFQGRFFSCPLDEVHQWAAIRYVERNPVRAGMASRAEEYAWSSAGAHCSGAYDALLDPDFPPKGAVPDWSEWLKDEAEQQSELVRRQTQTGRPCGTTDFVVRLENMTHRILQPLKRGRKSRLAVLGQGELFS